MQKTDKIAVNVNIYIFDRFGQVLRCVSVILPFRSLLKCTYLVFLEVFDEFQITATLRMRKKNIRIFDAVVNADRHMCAYKCLGLVFQN